MLVEDSDNLITGDWSPLLLVAMVTSHCGYLLLTLLILNWSQSGFLFEEFLIRNTALFLITWALSLFESSSLDVT